MIRFRQVTRRIIRVCHDFMDLLDRASERQSPCCPVLSNLLAASLSNALARMILLVAAALTLHLGPALAQSDEAASLSKNSSDYYPNTETLHPDEMRITALGTGLPTPLTRAQKSTSWLVELGNGDAFLFDLGTGSMENLFGLRPDFNKLDKVFLSHLHTDHFGDLDAFIVGSWLSGRYTPLNVYGPSASSPELGTKTAIESLQKALAWDIAGRTGVLPDAGAKVVVHELDYKGENAVVYEDNGVKITSWPAIHGPDGPISYRLDWNGLSFVFGGDTRPNKWFIEYAANADFVIHECFPTPEGLAAFNDWDLREATYVSSYIHTPPDGFGKVMAKIKPRMAVAYHTVLLPDIRQSMQDGIRKAYDGPLTIATDLMVWNVTKDKITQRMAIFGDHVTPPPTTDAFKKAKRSGEVSASDFITSGVWDGFKPPKLPEKK